MPHVFLDEEMMSHQQSWGSTDNYLVPRTPAKKSKHESRERRRVYSFPSQLDWGEYIIQPLSLLFKLFYLYDRLVLSQIEDWWPGGGTSLKMEYESSSSSLHSFFPYPPTLTCGELYTFGGVSHADMSMVMETIQPFFSPPGHSTASTGYLQDALIEWNKFSKRRRLSFDNNDGSSSSENIMEDFDCLREIMDTSRVPDDGLQTSLSSNSRGRKLAEEAISSSETTNSSSSCDMDDLFKIGDALMASEPPSSPEGDDDQGRRKKFGKRVAYPFAVVKPGGFDGNVTLNDINKRMHMPPTRPVKHPVGDFACRPCISPNGPGISGKLVVSFTKIQTRGSGTITIVRTRG